MVEVVVPLGETRTRHRGPRPKVVLLYAFERYWGKKPRLPLPMMHLAEAIREEFEPVIIDTRLVDDLDAVLREHLKDALCVGSSVMIGNQIRMTLAAGHVVRRIAPDVPIVWGGPFPTLAPEACLADDRVDFVLTGDGEQGMLALLRSLRDGAPLDDVPGLVHTGEDGEPVRTSARPLPDLTEMPMPAWDLVDPHDFKDFEVLASKGCFFGCTYCYIQTVHGRRWRSRAPERVVDEIAYLVDKFGAQSIQFVDDNFFQNRKHARAIMEAIIERGLDIRWEATCRASDLTDFSDHELGLLRDSGCKELFVGAETGSDEQLKLVKKRIIPDMITNSCLQARRAGIKIKLLWMMGLVGETPEQRLQTIDLMDLITEQFPDSAKMSSFGIYTPYPDVPATADVIAEQGHVLPEDLLSWADYYHDNANQTWLSATERRELEDLLWIQRYAHSRNRPKRSARAILDALLRWDARVRWRLRFFRFAPEWRLVRAEYNRFVERNMRRILGQHWDSFGTGLRPQQGRRASVATRV